MKEKRGLSIGLGIPTILLVFVSLGLCILSLMTYLEAKQNSQSVQKEIEYVRAYYQADAKAQNLIEEIKKGEDEKNKAVSSENGIDTYLFEISSQQELYVQIKDGSVQTYRVREKMIVDILDENLDVKEILKEAIVQNASDIFFVAGSPYAFKIEGKIVKQGSQILTPSLCDLIVRQLYKIAPYSYYKNFEEDGDDDFSVSLAGVGRFRVNAYRQRSSNAAVLRVVRFELPNYHELNIPQDLIDFSKEKRE